MRPRNHAGPGSTWERSNFGGFSGPLKSTGAAYCCVCLADVLQQRMNRSPSHLVCGLGWAQSIRVEPGHPMGRDNFGG